MPNEADSATPPVFTSSATSTQAEKPTRTIPAMQPAITIASIDLRPSCAQ